MDIAGLARKFGVLVFHAIDLPEAIGREWTYLGPHIRTSRPLFWHSHFRPRKREWVGYDKPTKTSDLNILYSPTFPENSSPLPTLFSDISSVLAELFSARDALPPCEKILGFYEYRTMQKFSALEKLLDIDIFTSEHLEILRSTLSDLEDFLYSVDTNGKKYFSDLFSITIRRLRAQCRLLEVFWQPGCASIFSDRVVLHARPPSSSYAGRSSDRENSSLRAIFI